MSRDFIVIGDAKNCRRCNELERTEIDRSADYYVVVGVDVIGDTYDVAVGLGRAGLRWCELSDFERMPESMRQVVISRILGESGRLFRAAREMCGEVAS